jgi:hypothetical protein
VHADYGSGSVTFWVAADGAIREASKAERDSINAASSRRAWAQIHDADSAIAKCKRGYANAVSAQDSAAIDRAVWTDTTRLGRYSCEWFRQYYWSRFQEKR